jgi:soluble P-type ATPase
VPDDVKAVAVPALAHRLALRGLDHLMLDVNGTLTNRGALLPGVETSINDLRPMLSVHLMSADTFGTLESTAQLLRASAVRAASGDDKLTYLNDLGRDRCAVIGNGANDVQVLAACALGFAVIGPEEANSAALAAADVVCTSVLDAFGLLLEPRALAATLRP